MQKLGVVRTCSEERKCAQFEPGADGELSLRTLVGGVHSGLGSKSRELRPVVSGSPPPEHTQSGAESEEEVAALRPLGRGRGNAAPPAAGDGPAPREALAGGSKRASRPASPRAQNNNAPSPPVLHVA